MSDSWKNLRISTGAGGAWLLNEEYPATSFVDVSGNSRNLSGSANFLSSPDDYHQPGLLPGDGDFCAVTGLTGNDFLYRSSIPAFSGSGTMECWVTFGGVTVNGSFLTAGDGRQFEIKLASSVVVATLVTAGGTKTASSGQDTSLTGPVHLVATFDSTSLKMYINGVLKATAAAGDVTYNGDPSTFYVGFPMIASVEKVAIYPTALSATVIKNLYAASTTSFRLLPVTLFAGNTDIARRFRDSGVNGQSMRMLHIGDSISANLGAGMQRGLKPAKWVGFLAGNSSSTPNVSFGVSLGNVNRGWGTWATDAVGTSTFTSNGGTTSDATGDANLQENVVTVAGLATPFTYAHELYAGDFIYEALFRGVQPVVSLFLKKTVTGDNAQFFAGLNLDQFGPAVRVPSSGTLTCSGTGWSTVNVTLPLDTPAVAAYGHFIGFFSIDSLVTTNLKTLTVAPWIRVSTGEAGFEYGNIAVGSTTLATWSAANGVWGDDLLGAYCTGCVVDTFLIILGQNDALITNFQTHLNSLVSRLRGLVPNCAIVLASSYETNFSFGSSNLAQMDAACRLTAIKDSNILYLDLNRYTGPLAMTYANTGAVGTGALFYDNYVIGDGAHPSDSGKALVAEKLDALLQIAAGGDNGQLHWDPAAPKRW